MASFPIPLRISAVEAVKLIAGSKVIGAGAQVGLSKEQMITLARTACRTEGITWECLATKAKKKQADQRGSAPVPTRGDL